MKQESDIDLYTTTPESYEQLQYQRDDYRLAMEASLRAATLVATPRRFACADFCGGTGGYLERLDAMAPLTRALIIDVNYAFLEIARRRTLRFCEIETVCADVTTATVPHDFDLVLATFAYHHVPNNEKLAFLAKARDALRDGGRIVLTEIYLPDLTTTQRYYQKVLDEIPGGRESCALRTFLEQTANSTTFEFKVTHAFAAAQFRQLGLRVISEEMVWPRDNAFGAETGTFVTALTKS